MKDLILPLFAGLVGSIAMAGLMVLPARLNLFRVDIVRAVGAFVSHDREHAFTPGIIIHLIVGALCAVFYNALFKYMGIPLFAGTGLFAGLVHGAIVMLFVSIFILEHHPMKRYQRRGVWTGYSQVFGHGFYGLIVGAIIGFFNLHNHFWPG